MGREIKFRAKAMGTGEWAYGSFGACCPGDCYLGKIGAVEGQHIHFDGVLCETRTIGQYTGLKDKNTSSREVFEGDIIDENGKVVGNVYENAPLLERGAYLLIQGFGTASWLATYKKAVERGCYDSQ